MQTQSRGKPWLSAPSSGPGQRRRQRGAPAYRARVGILVQGRIPTARSTPGPLCLHRPLHAPWSPVPVPRSPLP
eukprot:7582920-Alexandrium_andersonii.AAC.1